jgi:hypothetical protein
VAEAAGDPDARERVVRRRVRGVEALHPDHRARLDELAGDGGVGEGRLLGREVRAEEDGDHLSRHPAKLDLDAEGDRNGGGQAVERGVEPEGVAEVLLVAERLAREHLARRAVVPAPSSL